MSLAFINAGLFSLAAIALLGSPGPAIAALLVVGKGQGLRRGLAFYGGLQVGLALAAAVSAAGLFSILQAFPAVLTTMSILATIYLVYIAYQIAVAPVGLSDGSSHRTTEATSLGGFLLGITNPKAYVAFVTLMASSSIAGANASLDAVLKWLICVVVMIVVDLAWLGVGVGLRRAGLGASAERALNVTMGATILVVAVLPFWPSHCF